MKDLTIWFGRLTCCLEGISKFHTLCFLREAFSDWDFSWVLHFSPMAREMRNKKKYIFLLLFFIGSSCVFLLSFHHRPSEVITLKEDFVYYSTLCQCNRTIPAESFNNGTGILWCSEESSLRGFHQNVVSYSVYGKAGSDPDSNIYFMLINTIPRQVQLYYPGKSIPCIKSICILICIFFQIDIHVRLEDQILSPIQRRQPKGASDTVQRVL